MVRMADFVPAPNVADKAAVVVAPTAKVETVNVAEDCPFATGTLAGTEALGDELFNLMFVVVLPTTPFNVTVPVTDDPPPTEVGFKTSDVIKSGSSVKLADTATLFKVALIGMTVFSVTADTGMRTVVLLLPPRIFTDLGRLTLFEALVSATATPPEGAIPLSATIAEMLAGPTTKD